MGKKSKLIIVFTTTFFVTFVIGIILMFGYSSVLKDVKKKDHAAAMTQQKEEQASNGIQDLQSTPNDARSDLGGGSFEIESDKRDDVATRPGAGAGDDISQIKKNAAKTDEDSQNEIAESEAGEDLEISAESEKHAVLAFAGDICFHDAFSNMGTLSARGGRMKDVISQDLLDEMIGADVFMVNNEFPYSRRGTPLAEKMYTFRSKPENVKLLGQMGVDIVGIANNHAFDYGEEAFLDTLDTLDEAGIARVGGGRNLDEASKPYFFEKDGIKIAYLAATQIERNANPDTRGATEERAGVLRCFSEKELNHFLEVIQKTKQECDFLVVFIHWGTESTDVLDWAQPYQADLISKAGADLIVGGHPHVLQGLDIVNNVPVIYSLGNYWFNSKTMDTMLLKVEINQDGVEQICLIPALQSNCTTTRLYDSEKARVLTYLQSLSPNLHIDSDGIVTW